MLWLINFIKKRPTDKTILLSRIFFWILYILVLYYNLIYLNKQIETNYFWVEVSEDKLTFIKYWFLSFWLIPIIKWCTNICLLKSKYIRIVQILFWIIIFYISWKIMEWPNLDVDTLLIIMWLFPLFAWISWKCITTKCLKYWQTITRVRV